MPVEPEFSSIEEANAAYYGDDYDPNSPDNTNDGGSDNTDSTGVEWSGRPVDSRPLPPDWTLVYEETTDGNQRRWFVLRNTNGRTEAINSQGKVYAATDGDQLGDLPHYATESDAIEAYNKWAEENGQETVEEIDDEWGKWQRVRHLDPWWLWARTHVDGEQVQFVLAGMRDGQAVYLDANGRIVTRPVTFESVDAVQAALDAYHQRVQDGEIPPEEQPNGDSPSREIIETAVRETATSQSSRVVEKFGGKTVIVAALAVAGLAALAQAGDSQ